VTGLEAADESLSTASSPDDLALTAVLELLLDYAQSLLHL
jgi:hypothetical protein